jgi:alpha-amylase
VRTGEEGRDGCVVLMCNGDEGFVLRVLFQENSRPIWIFPSHCRYKSMEVGKVQSLLFLFFISVKSTLLQEHANEKWTDVLGWHPGEVIIDQNGWGVFRCPARSVSIWVKEDAIGREEFGKK